MTAPDELERAVERLTAALNADHAKTLGGAVVRTFDLRLLLSERAELLAAVERMREALEPTNGDLWWNPGNYEDGFLHWADAFENANQDGEDYSVELHRARKLPPVWGALVWIDGEQKVKIFATEAEADEARAALTTGEEK